VFFFFLKKTKGGVRVRNKGCGELQMAVTNEVVLCWAYDHGRSPRRKQEAARKLLSSVWIVLETQSSSLLWTNDCSMWLWYPVLHLMNQNYIN